MSNNSTKPLEKFDPRDLRNAFGTFATGVTIVTTCETTGTPRGFTANSFTSVSLDPPLVLICIGKNAASMDVFCGDSTGFAVNILSEGQEEVSGLFATQRPDKFDIADWKSGVSGMPLIDGTNAWFECERENVVDAGDHVILIGRVTDYGYERGSPLGYVNGGYFTLELEQSLIDAASRGENTVIGAILAHGNSILLHVDPTNGELSLPTSKTLGSNPNPDSFSASLKKRGIDASLDFLLSAYNDKNSDEFLIFYRGASSENASDDLQMVAIDEIDYDRIADNAMRFMLRRYVKEMQQGRYSIYLGDQQTGQTRSVDSEAEVSIDV